MKKNKVIKIMLVCVAALIILTITYYEVSNKEHAKIFENLIYKEREIVVEKIDINEAMSLQEGANKPEQYPKESELKQDITALSENEIIKNMEFYKIDYNFEFQDVEDIDGEMMALAVVSNHDTEKKVEDIIYISTNIYSKEYELLWVSGSESLEVNQVENSARIGVSGYLKIKKNNKMYYSNTINLVYIFEPSLEPRHF